MPKAMGTWFHQRLLLHTKKRFLRLLKACYGHNGHVLHGGGPKDFKNTFNSFLTIATETCFDKLVLSHIKSFESLQLSEPCLEYYEKSSILEYVYVLAYVNSTSIHNKRRCISQFGKLICLSQKNLSNGTDFGILCFILPILFLYVWDHI